MRVQKQRKIRLFSALSILGCLLIALSLSSPAQGQDLKDMVDATIRDLRTCQNQDGTYGRQSLQPDVTSMVLFTMATSPRKYTDRDGPFVRKAAEGLIATQRADGSFKPAEHGDIVRSTALVVAALSRVNGVGYADSISGATEFLVKQIEQTDSPIDPETCFALCLAFAHERASILATAESRCGEGPRAQLYKSVCRLMSGREIAAGFVTEWREKLERNIRQADAPELSPIAILAACELFLELENSGTPPLLWADRMAGIAISRIADLDDQPMKNHLAESALIAAAMSLCAESAQKAERQAAPPDEAPPLPDIVATPLGLNDAVAKGLDFLDGNQKSGKFGFDGYDDPGITGMALSAAIRSARLLERSSPSYVDQGLHYLDSLRKDDGSIFLTGLKTYVTSVALMAFVDSRDPAYSETIEKARAFLVAVQADEDEGYSMEEDPFYGGLGYGGDERPDLSNTQMALDALRAAGLDKDHEAFQKALNFIRKCQNQAETNPTEVILSDGRKVVAGTDGGGIYYPGDSKAGVSEVDKGVFVARSYGSMTYALLKSLIFTGLDRKDKRVKAAVTWVENHYTLEENPGFEQTKNPDAGQQGLFYYYLTMARALDAFGREIITDSRGTPHPWKKELAQKILSIQRIDGSWINERSPRWFEGNPVLATSYALLVLDICAH